MMSRSLRVLLLEDNASDAYLFRELLDEAEAGHVKVERCIRLEDALLHLQTGSSDVALVDLHLPDSTGLDTFRSLHLAYPKLPIVVLSGTRTHETAIQAVREGAQDYLVKGSVDGPAILRSLEYAIERKRVTYEQSYLATHDSLTSLPNRVYLQQILAHRITDARICGHTLGVLMIDLDRFKEINDTHGHQIGDRTLIEAARRMRSVVRHGDTVARLSGDEFVVVLPGLADPDEASQVAAKVTQALSQPLAFDDVLVPVGASVGTAAFPRDGTDVSSLLHAADVAMYEVKSANGQHKNPTELSASSRPASGEESSSGESLS